MKLGTHKPYGVLNWYRTTKTWLSLDHLLVQNKSWTSEKKNQKIMAIVFIKNINSTIRITCIIF